MPKYRTVNVTLVVRADNTAEMCDGISETMRSLDPGWLLDWGYADQEGVFDPEVISREVEYDPATYVEGEVFDAPS